ncbi:MAG: TolB family protein [Gammaproteobacteria bacterium]
MQGTGVRAFAAGVLLAGAAGAALADDLNLSVLETGDLRLIYFDPAQTYLVPHVVRSFHNSLDWQRRVFGWVPYEKTTLLLKDFTDAGNAGARSAPNNAITVDIAPLSRTFETFTSSERIYMLMNHELVHVVTMDQFARQDERWRRIFAGKLNPEGAHPETLLYSYQTVPRVTVPRWYLEGSAVFMETWMAGGIGRAQGAYDEMVFRAMVRDAAHFHDPVGLVSAGVKQDFQVGVNAYLYGTRFISWCALAHSPEKVLEWFKRVDGTGRYYADHFEQVFGKPLDHAWQDWIAWEKTFQAANLEAVKQYPITPARPITPEPLGSISRAFVDEQAGVLYSAVRRPGVLAHLGAISLADGGIRHLEDIKGPALYKVTSLVHVPQSQLLVYTTDNNLIRDLVAYDLATGDSRLLQKDARIGDLARSAPDNTLYGIRHQNGLATLVRLPPPYEKWTQVHTFPYGTDVYDIDVSPDGTRLSASIGGIDGRQRLAVYELAKLAAGQATAIVEQDFGTAVPEGFVFSADGRYLFGSSYYTGVSNIFRYELKTRQLEMVTNTDTGMFRPVPLANGDLIAFSYSGNGFQPVVVEKPRPLQDASNVKFLGAEIARKYPVVASWEAGSPARVDFEKLVTRRDRYLPLRELELAAAYPLVEGYKDSVGAGALMRWADPMGFDSIELTVSHSPDSELPADERTHAELTYKHLGWQLRASHNDADFYDLFGPTKRSRRADAAGFGYGKALIYDKPRELHFSFDADHYSNLERLPDAQNITATFDTLTQARAGLEYSYVLNSLGSVDDEKGVRWEAVVEANHVNGETIPRYRAGLDFGLPVGPAHSTVWLLNAAGMADGDRLDPFANFFFGGFGNNYVDDGEIKRYRKHYALPGFELNALGGRTFAKSTLEWNLPPLVFDRVGTPGFYLAWARPSVFGTGLVHNFDESPGNAQSAGVQVDLRFQVMHRLDMTLSAGYARGWIDRQYVDDEVMVSLKIL